MRDCWRWSCWEDLYAHFVYQQYFSYFFDNFSANVVVDGNTINLGLWDTAGQEDYNRLRPLSYRGADVFLLAFSLISKASNENVAKKWIPELKHYTPGVPVILIGTKLDLRDDKEYFANHPGVSAITAAQGEELRKLSGAPAYIECSSKTQQVYKISFFKNPKTEPKNERTRLPNMLSHTLNKKKNKKFPKQEANKKQNPKNMMI
ncbi:hypothetical protein LUZ60_011898 [Juncus effusus]|nr:hypothetical protein LUZ60_011898 [Juncus effusus]